ncbi:MAG: imidazole glycerol phosphate synthase subunit HisF [Chloroflexi bacterium]|nr:imidazole glycerol phosphate synthase subunit HisF [Chloroflexota bacterium]MBI2979687.1 imidazole glycerol phosphate synthase subunit HisF [Chloroflexota bacterium]
MLRTRVIPCLLLKDKGLVKTIRFTQPTYIGDPINAVRIFNTKEVDELVFLDITATIEGRKLPIALASIIANECSMPFAIGGGIKTLDDIKELLNMGAEKVVINTQAVEDPSLIKTASNLFGNQSIVVSIDAKQQKNGAYEVYTHGGTRATGIDPVTMATKMEAIGAGEILLTSIDRDGTMQGYDLELIKLVTDATTVPIIACGGAGELSDFADAVRKGGASAVAAGSMFVFHGRRRAVLINFPTRAELESSLN